ncbi:hypothetical protein [Pedobacter insulae]|uniref:Uncharacterized protein n=1 Tax=Pedobacter insulae TaxID=414048 RepID=A0A1I2WEX8_9SPHI|nr:hypothetical protein [Pedobacter insulae]SFG99872.1 hypothetical protein SAMN04489864_10410 [Pedobacter insulae]
MFIAFIFAVACKKKSSVLDADVSISVLTADGKNALSSPALYNASNISAYHIVDGQPQRYLTPSLGGAQLLI